MSLYGLDIIESKGTRKLTEINGINSGMSGFCHIYGDNRVQEQVWKMLGERYGDEDALFLNDGSFISKQRRKKLFKKNPPLYIWSTILLKTVYKNKVFLDSVLDSSNADIDWLVEEATRQKALSSSNSAFANAPFRIYRGEKSGTVINSAKTELPESLRQVNNPVAEEIVDNKFLQYLLLKDSPMAEHLIPTTLGGMGTTHEQDLEKLLSSYETFVVKPLLSWGGNGFRHLTGKEVRDIYANSRGPILPRLRSLIRKGPFGEERTLHALAHFLSDDSPYIPLYVEDLVEKRDFAFEKGLSIVQPFVDSRNDQGEYSILRAIVCNGVFVNAYRRVSADCRVNLTRGARAERFEATSALRDFCEQTVRIFESRAEALPAETFKQSLYAAYFDERGKTTTQQREKDTLIYDPRKRLAMNFMLYAIARMG